jgi:short-subunit dehydrogenase
MAAGTALITGASSGIGAELAKVCAARGHDLILVARRQAELEDLAAALSREHGIRARVVAADLADAAAPQAIFEQVRGTPVDILINNAGFGLRGAFAETEWAVEARMVQVNIAALLHLTKLFLPEMIRRRSGRIMNVGSTAGFVPGPCMSVYYASKAFVLSFSEAIANELQGTGVTVTDLCPGPTRTEFGKVAGAANTRLARGATMSAADVAREGYDAMMAGKVVAIAGARNRWTMLVTRLVPRSLVARVVRRYNSPARSVNA